MSKPRQATRKTVKKRRKNKPALSRIQKQEKTVNNAAPEEATLLHPPKLVPDSLSESSQSEETLATTVTAESSSSTSTSPAPPERKISLLEKILMFWPEEAITSTQRTAIMLYELNFNVFPVPFAKKGGFRWQRFQFTRLHPNALFRAFAGACNLAVLAGRTSDNLFFIDCETDATFAQQGELLRSRGIPIWAVRSGGFKNGGHYYLRCADGEVENIRSGRLPDLEVRGNRCYVIAPPSVHPDTGGLYEWAMREVESPPLVHVHDLDWLPLRLSKPSKKVSISLPDESPSPLSSNTRDFVANGASEGERNNRLFAAACDMAGNGMDYLTISDILTPAAMSSGMPEREIRDTIRSATSKPRESARNFYATSLQTPNPRQLWQTALTWAQQQNWSGRSGQTDRAVFLACCERARLGGNTSGTFRASVREVAELARLDKKSAHQSLKRLTEKRYLESRGQDKVSGSSLWRFASVVGQSPEFLGNGYTNNHWYVNCVPFTKKSDAAEHKALGKTAFTLWETLLQAKNPLTPKEIAALAGLSLNQVYAGLHKLAGYEMTVKENRLWLAIPRSEEWLIEHVVAPSGAAGMTEKRKAKHAEDRARRASMEIVTARFQRESRPE